jgi:hypothetical protein
MTFRPGDRVRLETTADDGLPLVRYGFVGGVSGTCGPVVVMLDGELGGDIVDLGQLQPVTITNVELCLHGMDLFENPDLRRGLVALWQAEADQAGISMEALHPIGEGLRDSSDSWALAELTSGGEHYVVRAVRLPHEPEFIRVRADRPTRFELM